MTREERIEWLKQYLPAEKCDEVYEAVYSDGYLDAARLAIEICETSDDKDAKLCVKTFKDEIELNNVYGSN